MSKLDQIRELAANLPFNLSGDLSHDDHVVPLVTRWKPIVFFHEDERFHPVGMDGLTLIPREVYRATSAAGQAALEVSVNVPDVGGGTVTRNFPPPALHTPNDSGDGRIVQNDTDDSLIPFGVEAIGKKTILTHGPGFTASNSIFGSLHTVSGLEEPSEGDPREPRHPIRVVAEFRMALESLHYMLEVDAMDKDEYPKIDDSIWNPASIGKLFFGQELDHTGANNSPPISESLAKEVLLDVIRGELSGDMALQDAALVKLPGHVFLITDVFETARNAAFVEYQFIYGYNDWDRYENFPANYHEGDDEGCCFIFDRRLLEEKIASGDTAGFLQIPPMYVLTSVHLADHGADKIKEFDVLGQNAVYVARGSHATFLTEGTHDPASAGVAFEESFRAIPWWISLPTFGAVPILAGLLGIIYEHFAGPEDETSNDGIVGAEPDQFPPGTPTDRLSPVTLDVFPTSAEVNQIGNSPSTAEEDGLLGLRSYAGRLGAHSDSRGRTSPLYKRKFDRFFAKLIRSGYRI